MKALKVRGDGPHAVVIGFTDGSCELRFFGTADEAGLFHGRLRTSSNVRRIGRARVTKAVSREALIEAASN